MKTQLFKIVFFTTSLLLPGFGCQKEALDRDYSQVLTLPVTEINPTGATFSAEIISNSGKTIQKVGFLFSTDEEKMSRPDATGINIVPLDLAAGETNFSYRVTSGIGDNFVYFVRAFVQHEDITLYGPIVSFESKGSLPPEITSVLPLNAVEGDTVIIKGNNFTNYQKSDLAISTASPIHQNSYFTVLSSTATEIKAIMPNYLAVDETLKVFFVVVHYGIGSEPFLYKVPLPLLDSRETIEVSPGEIITLTGNYFSTIPSINKLRFLDVDCEILSASKTQLQFKIPSNVKSDASVTLSISNRILNLTGRLKLKK